MQREEKGAIQVPKTYAGSTGEEEEKYGGRQARERERDGGKAES